MVDDEIIIHEKDPKNTKISATTRNSIESYNNRNDKICNNSMTWFILHVQQEMKKYDRK